MVLAGVACPGMGMPSSGDGPLPAHRRGGLCISCGGVAVRVACVRVCMWIIVIGVLIYMWWCPQSFSMSSGTSIEWFRPNETDVCGWLLEARRNGACCTRWLASGLEAVVGSWCRGSDRPSLAWLMASGESMVLLLGALSQMPSPPTVRCVSTTRVSH
jgi:hypothetical protein